MKVLKNQNYKLSTLNNPEMKELTALALLWEMNLKTKLDNAQNLANKFSSNFTNLLQIISENFDNSIKFTEILAEAKTEQSIILQRIEYMSTVDQNKILEYLTKINDHMIDEYDKEREELWILSNPNNNLLSQNHAELKTKIESYISSYSEKCQELANKMESEDIEYFDKKIICKK